MIFEWDSKKAKLNVEKHQVYFVIQGVINQLVEGDQEIIQTRRKPGGGVDFPVVFNAQVEVGKVDDFHGIIITGKRISSNKEIIEELLSPETV